MIHISVVFTFSLEVVGEGGLYLTLGVAPIPQPDPAPRRQLRSAWATEWGQGLDEPSQSGVRPGPGLLGESERCILAV